MNSIGFSSGLNIKIWNVEDDSNGSGVRTVKKVESDVEEYLVSKNILQPNAFDEVHRRSAVDQSLAIRRHPENVAGDQREFFQQLKNNCWTNGIQKACGSFLRGHGPVEYCAVFAHLLKKKLVPESRVLEILQMEILEEEFEGGGGGSLYSILASPCIKKDMKAISRLFDQLSDKSIMSLFCNDGSSADSVLANLVKYGDAEGVKDFSQLMRYVGPRIGGQMVEEMLLNDKDALGASLACGESSMVQALGGVYSSLSTPKGLAAVLATPRGISTAIERGYVDALKTYCATVQSIHPMLGKKEKALILKAMRNAELRGIIFHAQSPEFVKLCKENPDFYGVFKSTKNILKT